MYKEIHLSNGMIARVSECDYEMLSEHNWYLSKCYYTGRPYASAWIDGKNVTMHRLIMRDVVPDGLEVDHRDLDGLNNTRENLRPATRSQNMANTGKRPGVFSSIYKGVHRLKENYFKAYIMVRMKRIHLGYFRDEDEAAKAYDRAAVFHFGEFARLNFSQTA